MTHSQDVYGYVNGNAVYSRNEFIYAARGFGELKTNEDLLAYAEKVTHGWYHAGWHRSFIDYYLSDYALSEPCRSLTKTEFERLKNMQMDAQREAERVEAEKEWRLVDTIYWADNSVEEIWENKYGERKKIMTTGPHGDAC